MPQCFHQIVCMLHHPVGQPTFKRKENYSHHLLFLLLPICCTSCDGHFIASEACGCKPRECATIPQSNSVHIISVLPVRGKIVQISIA